MRNDNGVANRALRALLYGVVVGIVVALVVWLLASLTPLELDPGFWGTVAGVIAGLYSFLTGETRV